MHPISKSLFLNYLQCPKLFWTAYNLPNAFPPTAPSTEYRMLEGRKVESYARNLFPNAILIDHSKSFKDIIAQSNVALKTSTAPIFNAILSANNLIAEVDILVPVKNGWEIFEVKASASQKDDHIPDIAFQRYVAKRMGLNIRKCNLILVNNSYVLNSKLDPKDLFLITDISNGVSEFGDLNAQVESALEICQRKACPQTQIGLQCSDDCPLRDNCWKKIDEKEDNIFNLYRLPRKRALGWLEQGIVTTGQIPKDYPLNDAQRIQQRANETGQLQVNKRAVKVFLNRLKYPLYALDFETFASPIPLIDNSSPFQPIPFQYSLHVIENDLSEEPKHFSWIWDCEGDPREILLRKLEALLGDKGSIIAYNDTFEKGILKKAVEKCPEYEKWLQGINRRFVDLLMPFRSFAVYHPGQQGSCSLKDVLPAITGQDYSGLGIQEGETASRAFMGILGGEIKGREKDKVLKDLEEYCHLDTLAMVMILRKVKGMIWLNNP